MQKQPKKWETVRVVTFLEEFKSKDVTGKNAETGEVEVKKAGKTLYKKGREVAMTLKAAKKLESRGAKIKIAPFNRQAATNRARKEFEEANKKKTELMYARP
jgi:hypothetical protein